MPRARLGVVRRGFHRAGGLGLGFVWACVLAACAAGAAPVPSAGSPVPAANGSGNPASGPSATSVSSPAASAAESRVAEPDLKIRLVERFGPLWYCDPDAFPVARDDEAARALERWPEIAADAPALDAIEKHLGMGSPGSNAAPTDAQKLAIYREWKVLRAIGLDAAGPGAFDFDYLAMPAGGLGDGTRWKGTIDAAGTINVTSSTRAPAPICPICLARGERIATPLGPVAVEVLRVGDPVWTRDARGVVVAGAVIAVGSTEVPHGHEVVRLDLADGRSLVASPGHPLADGRTVGALQPGDVVAGSVVTAAGRLAYADDDTFDILPSGPTATYEVQGIWLRSTLLP